MAGPSIFALLRSLMLPVTVAIVIPIAVLRGEGVAPIFGRIDPLGAAVGGPIVAAGVALICWTVSLFARKGRGTLAPWDPPRQLVVAGPYQHTRNPMITGVSMVVFGESIGFHSWGLAAWATTVVVVNHVYFVFSEEPGLRKRFDGDYDVYARHVPRWIPRLTAWRPAAPKVS